MEEKYTEVAVWLDFVQISLDCLKVLDGLLWAKKIWFKVRSVP